MSVQLSIIVDLFLMGFPIMQAILPIRSHPREAAVEQACVEQLLLSAVVHQVSWATVWDKCELKLSIQVQKENTVSY